MVAISNRGFSIRELNNPAGIRPVFEGTQTVKFLGITLGTKKVQYVGEAVPAAMTLRLEAGAYDCAKSKYVGFLCEA